MNHQLPGPMSYAPESYNGPRDNYPKWMQGSLLAKDHVGHWHVAVIEDIDRIDHDDSHTATANLLAAAYTAFDKAARDLGVDATELARNLDIAAVLRQAMRTSFDMRYATEKLQQKTPLHPSEVSYVAIYTANVKQFTDEALGEPVRKMLSDAGII